MPKNESLQPVELPMEQKWGKKPTTLLKNNLSAIDVELIAAPTPDELRDYLPQFLEATWAEDPNDARKLSVREKDELIRNCILGKSLPTALETINLVFKISGISIQEATHLIRYRTGSFSADCSGDKWWTDRAALVPWSIENSPEFLERYKQIAKDAKQLYCDMIDSKEVSIMDARYILPRCLETFYFMRMNLKDAIAFINQRIDKQIQPETDNIIAYQMACGIVAKIPYCYDIFDFHKPSMFYVNMARTGKATNLYFPDEDSDIFEWHPDDFIYQKYRNEMNGTAGGSWNLFKEIFEYFNRLLYRINIEAKKYLCVE